MTAALGPEPDLGLTPRPIIPLAMLTALVKYVGLNPADVVWMRIDATTVQVDVVRRDRLGRIEWAGRGWPVTETHVYAIDGAGQQWPGATLTGQAADTATKDST